jgi:hypothetical protein
MVIWGEDSEVEEKEAPYLIYLKEKSLWWKITFLVPIWSTIQSPVYKKKVTRYKK